MMSRTIENLVSYVENPQPTTVLVLNYKYKKIDKRKALYKAIKKTGVVYESKKLYENQVGDWIRRVLSPKDYTISPKAAQMLVGMLQDGGDAEPVALETNVVLRGSLGPAPKS